MRNLHASSYSRGRHPTAPAQVFAAPAGLPGIRVWIAATAIVLSAIVGLASVARAQSGLQITPNRVRTLISKDVAGQRWAITYNSDDNTVTGNVFFPGGGDPQFVYCEQLSSSPTVIQFGCYGAGPCNDATCPLSDWSFLAAIDLPVSFVTPRGGSVCGNGVLEPGELCDPPGDAAQCGTGRVCSADCRACSAPPTCQLWQPLLGSFSTGASSCGLQLVLDNRACSTPLSGLSGALYCSNGSADLSALLAVQVPAATAGAVSFNASSCLGTAYVTVSSGGITKSSNVVSCSAPSSCGNGVLDFGEQCDPGSAVLGCPTFPDLLVCNPSTCQCEPGIL